MRFLRRLNLVQSQPPRRMQKIICLRVDLLILGVIHDMTDIHQNSGFCLDCFCADGHVSLITAVTKIKEKITLFYQNKTANG